MVEDTANELKDYTRRGLRVYWELGRRVQELKEGEDNVYAGHTLENFAADLYARTGVLGFGRSTLYKCGVFYERCQNSVDLNKLIENGFSWRNALALYTNENMISTTRRHIIDQVASGELDQRRVMSAIKARTAPREVKAMRPPVMWLQSMTKQNEEFRATLKDVRVHSEQLRSLPIAERKANASAITKSMAELDALILAASLAKKELEELVDTKPVIVVPESIAV